MWGQRNQKIQTLMIVDTLMLGLSVAIMVEGQLPLSTYVPLVIAFSFFLSCSFIFLLISVWFAMRMQARMTQYNIQNDRQRYVCGGRHFTFADYFNCHCQLLGKLAALFFYAGSASLILASIILCSTRFVIDYDIVAAAVVFSVVAGCGVIALVALPYFMPTATRVEESFRFQHGAVPTSLPRPQHHAPEGLNGTTLEPQHRQRHRSQHGRDEEVGEVPEESKIGDRDNSSLSTPKTRGPYNATVRLSASGMQRAPSNTAYIEREGGLFNDEIYDV